MGNDHPAIVFDTGCLNNRPAGWVLRISISLCMRKYYEIAVEPPMFSSNWLLEAGEKPNRSMSKI
jgi:hypothetical protein